MSGRSFFSVESLPLCQNGMIPGKSYSFPESVAENDNILDANERFDLFICPFAGAAPNPQFTVAITLPWAALPLPVAITPPGGIRPITAPN